MWIALRWSEDASAARLQNEKERNEKKTMYCGVMYYRWVWISTSKCYRALAKHKNLYVCGTGPIARMFVFALSIMHIGLVQPTRLMRVQWKKMANLRCFDVPLLLSSSSLLLFFFLEVILIFFLPFFYFDLLITSHRPAFVPSHIDMEREWTSTFGSWKYQDSK